MERRSIDRFLARLLRRILPQAGLRNVMIPGICSPEVVESLEPVFRADLSYFFTARALHAMDYLALNQYWFIMMAAAALVKARSLPATALDVQTGVLMLRHRLLRDDETRVVFEKLRANQAERLNAAQMAVAKREGMLLWEENFPQNELMRVNLVFFQHTGEVCHE